MNTDPTRTGPRWRGHAVTSAPTRPGAGRHVLSDVDGTLIDAVDNQPRLWRTWAERCGLAPDELHQVALRTGPLETFAQVAQVAQVAPDRDPQECLALLHEHELEDDDVRSGTRAAFDGAAELLSELPPGSWALVTSNHEYRVRGGCRRGQVHDLAGCRRSRFCT